MSKKKFCNPYVFLTAKVKTKSNQAVLGLKQRSNRLCDVIIYLRKRPFLSKKIEKKKRKLFVPPYSC